MADLVRVFAAEAATTPIVEDRSHDSTAPPDIVFQVEASAAEFAGAQKYRVGGWVRNRRTGTVAELGAKDGSLGGPGWPTRNHNIVFSLPAAIAGEAQENDMVELGGYVRVGLPHPGADADIDKGEFVFVV